MVCYLQVPLWASSSKGQTLMGRGVGIARFLVTSVTDSSKLTPRHTGRYFQIFPHSRQSWGQQEHLRSRASWELLCTAHSKGHKGSPSPGREVLCELWIAVGETHIT